MIPRFAVYIFDVDGTLLDSARDICGAIQQVLETTGCAPVTFDFLKGYIGLHLDDLFHDIFPGCTPELADSLLQQYRGIYRARGHSMTRVFPGVAEALAGLGGRKTTATTKGTPMTRAVLDQFGLIGYFDHVQGTDGFPSKPAPDVILTAAAALGARPEDCLMVGDSPADMEAGKRAGVKTCAVRYGYGKPEELAKFEPDFWVDDLRALA
ncbi:HAD-superfamily hydrolase, subfamily IA, variant 3 [Candidatus Sulfopaludibacter sp. SbA6]|nr:HAD-superfamily hydrolase, subfamily IA, variant 3 [Candidatus Sulfopaludibacter sp. SbA6]